MDNDIYKCYSKLTLKGKSPVINERYKINSLT